MKMSEMEAAVEFKRRKSLWSWSFVVIVIVVVTVAAAVRLVLEVIVRLEAARGDEGRIAAFARFRLVVGAVRCAFRLPPTNTEDLEFGPFMLCSTYSQNARGHGFRSIPTP